MRLQLGRGEGVAGYEASLEEKVDRHVLRVQRPSFQVPVARVV